MWGVSASARGSGEGDKGELARTARLEERRARQRTLGLRGPVIALAASVALSWATPALGGGTPATNGAATANQKLLTAGGTATGLAQGEYITNTAGLNRYYSVFIEVPTGTPRLRVRLFDPDMGTNSTNDWDTNVYSYKLLDPSGAVRASSFSDEAGPAASNNIWWTSFDSNAPTACILDGFNTTAYSNSDGTLPWLANWAEENDDGVSTTGRILATGAVLRMNPRNVANVAIARSANLSTLSSVTLSFSTLGTGLDAGVDERLAVEYSTTGGPPWTTLQDILLDNPLANYSYAGLTASATSRVRFRRSGSGWDNNASEYVDIDNVRLEGPVSSAAPAAGHWELRLDAISGQGQNGVGILADDGDGTGGGTELNVYYYSYFNYGTTETAGGTRSYLQYPWITSGCSCSAREFDADSSASFTLTTPTGTLFSNTTISGQGTWNTSSFSGWTTASNATGYGLWSLAFNVLNNASDNYMPFYIGDFSAGPTPPTAQPQASTFRVYLPTDAGAKPAKPYLEQQVRYAGGASGPNPPQVGQTSRFTVTVRLVNPTPLPITFTNSGTPAKVVTSNVPAGVTVYGGNAQVSQGSLVSQPTVGATGNVIWDPGVVAAGSTEILAYEVRVTPTVAGTINVTGTPTASGTNAVYFDETGNTTQVAQTRNTLGPLCELSVSTITPTLALLGETRAVSATPGVYVEWETVSEAGTAGFEIYRIAEGERVLVHSGLLEASLSPAGARYRLHDREARPRGLVQYEIVEVESDGERRSHGIVTFDLQSPVDRGTAGPERDYVIEPRMPEPPRLSRAAPFCAEVFGIDSVAAGDAAATGGASGEQMVVLDAPDTTSLRIETVGEGLTLVSWSSIAEKLGMTKKKVAKYAKDGRIALRRHDGSDAAWSEGADGILFWARPFDSLYARGSVYRLTFERGRRMPTASVSTTAGAPSPSFQERLHLEQDALSVVALPVSPQSDYWLWMGMTAGRPGFDTAVIPLSTPGLAAGAGQLTVGLQGASGPALGQHHLLVLVNGSPVGEAYFSGYERLDAVFDLPPGGLVDGDNTLSVVALKDPATSQSIVYVDSVDVTYARRYEALGARMFVFEAAASSPVVVTGLPAGSVSLFDVTDPSNPAFLKGFSVTAGELRFVSPPRSGRFVAAVDGAAQAPLALGAMETLDLRRALGAGAEYVVISSPELREPANRLATLRSGQGLSTRVISFQTIADQFAGGVRDPGAVRSFLEHASATWATKPRYVALAGAGSYDYRNLRGYGGNHVPVLLQSSGSGLFPADRGFVTAESGAALPIAVGRIPARTAAELGAFVDKLTAYEGATGPPGWAGRAIFLADDSEGGTDFGVSSDAAESRLGLAMTKERLHLGPLPAATVRSTLLTRFGEGFGLLSYFGHAGMDRIAVEQLLTNADVPTLPGTDGTPVVVALTCTLNRFGVPGFTTLGETLANRAGAGAVAVWSSSGLSDNANALALAQDFFSSLSAEPEARLGDAIRRAGDAYVRAEGLGDTLAFYNLLGDPALLFRRPVPPPPPVTGTGNER